MGGNIKSIRRTGKALWLLLTLAAAGAYSAAPASDDAHTIAAFESAIAALERDGGAQDPRLGELLTGLARTYENAARFEAALEAYRRAWHIQRISRGLHNLEQQELVDRIILLEARAGDWEAVADGYDYLLWLYRRNYAEDDPRWLSAARRLRAWHLDAYELPTGRDFTEHMDRQIWLYRKAMRIIEKQTGDRRLAKCFWDERCQKPDG